MLVFHLLHFLSQCWWFESCTASVQESIIWINSIAALYKLVFILLLYVHIAIIISYNKDRFTFMMKYIRCNYVRLLQLHTKICHLSHILLHYHYTLIKWATYKQYTSYMAELAYNVVYMYMCYNNGQKNS